MRLAHGKVSAIDLELLECVVDRLDQIEESSARAIVLAGTGSSFSAGVDLFRVLDGGPDYLNRFLPALSRALVRLFTFPRPVVAAINGHAIAGGCILASACDYRLMALGKGKIGVPELVVGVPFPMIALEILRDLVPDRRFQEVVSCLSGCFSRPQHVAISQHHSRCPERPESVDRELEAVPHRGRVMFEKRPLDSSDDCAETRTHPGRCEAVGY